MPGKRYYENDKLIENISEPYPLQIQNRSPLSVTHPEIAAEWHYTKNKGYGPEDFSHGSNLKVWWKCSKNRRHSWQAVISNRTGEGQANCPHCYYESYGLDLRELPQVLKFFNKTKNPGIDPHKLPIGKLIWWHCKKGIKHDWHAKINLDVVDAFCPFCRGHKAAPDNNLTNYKNLAREFHPTKNGALSPKEIVPGSKRMIWWKCPHGDDHEFQMRPRDRTVKGYGCPFCSRRRFSETSSLLTEFPDVAAQWHPSKNGKLKPEAISSRSTEIVWWKCPEGKDHEWNTSIAHRTYHGTGCPYCANRAISKTNNLASVFPAIAKEFDLKKNAPVKPSQVIATSAVKYWWRCSRGHSYEREVYLRTKRGSTCPECPEYNQQTVKTSLAQAHPEIAEHWHPTKNGALKPDEVAYGSKKYVWWKCQKGPEHEWQQWVQNITTKGYQCPFCEGYRVSTTNNIQALFPGLAKEWHPKKNDKKASEVLPGSAYKPWWRCKSCQHEWQRECYLRTQRRSACPECKGYPG
ncbi:MAG: zinc-ribbon domain-containing protein [Candidatus Obscuribacter sp.]|nr:zinc-ribbon domain-containing protein [Candidatus Obscuribacter sp.]